MTALQGELLNEFFHGADEKVFFGHLKGWLIIIFNNYEQCLLKLYILNLSNYCVHFFISLTLFYSVSTLFYLVFSNTLKESRRESNSKKILDNQLKKYEELDKRQLTDSFLSRVYYIIYMLQ